MVGSLFPSTLLENTFNEKNVEHHASINYATPTKPSSIKDKEYASLESKAKIEVNRIYHTFVEDNSPQEINIESKVKKAIKDELAKDNLHPDVYYHAFQHIMNMLQTNHYRKFLLHTKKASEKATI